MIPGRIRFGKIRSGRVYLVRNSCSKIFLKLSVNMCASMEFWDRVGICLRQLERGLYFFAPLLSETAVLCVYRIFTAFIAFDCNPRV